MDLPLVIDVQRLAGLDPDALLLVDCRVDLSDRAKSRREYLQGHIPGAVFADLESDLSDLSRVGEGLGRHPLPSPQAFAAVLARWGWTPTLHVVAYDTSGGAMAARLWWMLRCAGGTASVLDGGLQAWTATGLPLQEGEVVRAPAPVPRTDFAFEGLYTEALRAGLGAGELRLLDARAAPRYRGETEPLDRVAGHVPGAGNRPFAENLDAQGRFRSPQELRAAFEAALAGAPPQQAVHMCGSGVTACHNLLAMEYAGLHGSRLYPPSWSGWSSDPQRPVATGDEAAG